MSSESRLVAGILLILMPTVVYGGTAILSMLVSDPEYAQNQLRQDLWRAGHAHAGVLLVLSLVALRYVDEAALSKGMRKLVRHSIPDAAVLLPLYRIRLMTFRRRWRRCEGRRPAGRMHSP